MKALDNINSIKMFSDEGWSRVHEALKDISTDASDIELANGFIDFQIIWYEDNEVDPLEVDEDKVHDALLTRYSDYLLGD